METKNKYWLQPQLQVGNTRIAALVRQTVHSAHGNPGVGFIGNKQPIAIIVVENSDHEIFGLDEGALPPVEAKRIRAEIIEFASKSIAAD